MRGALSWSRKFGQVGKLGLPCEEDGPMTVKRTRYSAEFKARVSAGLSADGADNLGVVGPLQDGVGRQLRAVAADDRGGAASLAHDGVQFPGHAQAADRGVWHERKALRR